MAGFMTLGIISYLILSCVVRMRDEANAKKVVVEDTEIQYETNKGKDSFAETLEKKEDILLKPG